MNKLIIIGNVCHRPELRTTQGGKDVATFTVAVNRRGGNQQTDYFRVSAWGKTGTACANYLDKGRKVCIIGEVSCRAYMGNNGDARASLEVTATEVEFLSAREQTSSDLADAEMRRIEAEQAATAQGFTELTDDGDLPF